MAYTAVKNIAIKFITDTEIEISFYLHENKKHIIADFFSFLFLFFLKCVPVKYDSEF